MFTMIKYEITVVRKVKLYNRNYDMRKGIILKKEGIELPFPPIFNMDIYDVDERLRTHINSVHYSLDRPGKIEAWGFIDYYVKKLFKEDIKLSLDNEWEFFAEVDQSMWKSINKEIK